MAKQVVETTEVYCLASLKAEVPEQGRLRTVRVTLLHVSHWFVT
jgi:hypothetical protein